jgi:hypothetical protein
MIARQILEFQKIGEECLTRARLAPRAKDAHGYIEAAERAFARARELMREREHNSLILFLEICALLGASPNYAQYLDFCARNGFESLSESDFNSVSDKIFLTD